MTAIKDTWRSIGYGIEENYVDSNNFKLRIADIHSSYITWNRKRKNSVDLNCFMAQVFLPFRTNKYESFRVKQRMKAIKNRVISSRFDCDLKREIRPSIVSIPRFNHCFCGDVSKWLQNTNKSKSKYLDMDSAKEEINFNPAEGVKRVRQYPFTQCMVCDRSSQTDTWSWLSWVFFFLGLSFLRVIDKIHDAYSQF